MSKKIIRKFTMIFIIVVSIVTTLVCAEENSDLESREGFTDNYILEKNNDGENTYTLTGISGNTYTNMIPSKINEKIITRIGDKAFKGKSNIYGAIKLPNTIISIGNEAFSECKNIISIDFASSVKHIGDYAFYSCESLSKISSYDNLEYLGERAFSKCYLLSFTYFLMPKNIKYIGSYALENVTIRYIKFYGGNAPEIKPDTFDGCTEVTVVVPKEGVGYTKENNWGRDFIYAYLYGDVNEDSRVNSTDASNILDKFKASQIKEEDILSSDMNYDEKLNSADAALILDIYKGTN